MNHFLIIDDEPDMLSGFTSILSALGYQSSAVTNGIDAFSLMEQNDFDLIFCDYQLPQMDGIEIIRGALKKAPSTPLIIFTAYGTIERAVHAMKVGAFDFLEKPIDTDKLKVVIEKGLRQRTLYKERNNLITQLEEKFSFDNIIGKSSEMRKVFDMIENISQTDANVLITGESGTGKELIARSIHAHSSRKTKPFIPVNCGALPEHLFEAELFGYEKGAFTGAMNRKQGLLEYANDGTFFLDEVCELNPQLQVKLLRVLQDHQLRRLGGNDLININFRIISATNKKPKTAVDDGTMRSDFYYRINVIHIDLPPVRNRKDDIPLLADFFLQKNNEKNKKQLEGFTNEVMELFMSNPWYGNVREIENVIERASVLARGNRIAVDDLPENMKLHMTPEIYSNRDMISLPEAKHQMNAELEKKYLVTLLQRHNGNVTKAAEEADMTRRNIHRLLKIHGIDPQKWRKE